MIQLISIIPRPRIIHPHVQFRKENRVVKIIEYALHDEKIKEFKMGDYVTNTIFHLSEYLCRESIVTNVSSP